MDTCFAGDEPAQTAPGADRDVGRDDPPEPRPPAPTWNAVPTTAAAAMAAGPLPPAPADPPAPPAPPGPSPDSEQPGDDADAASAPAPKARRAIVPAGDHLWGGRDGSASVAAVCPWTVAVLEHGQPEAQPEAPASGSFADGPADGRPPSRLHIVCHRGARLWGQVRASPPPQPAPARRWRRLRPYPPLALLSPAQA
jgi:hypothetical protein